MENDGLSKLIKQNHKEACVHINIKSLIVIQDSIPAILDKCKS